MDNTGEGSNAYVTGLASCKGGREGVSAGSILLIYIYGFCYQKGEWILGRQPRVSRAERKLEERSGRMIGMFQLNKGREKAQQSSTFRGRRRQLLTWRPRDRRGGLVGKEQDGRQGWSSCCEETSPHSPIPAGRTPGGKGKGWVLLVTPVWPIRTGRLHMGVL